MNPCRLKYILSSLVLFFAFANLHAQGDEKPPEMTAELLDSIYCIGTEKYIVEDFTLKDEDLTKVDGIFIQISSGYEVNRERLEYIGGDTRITQFWYPPTGKLKLSFAETSDYSIIIEAVKNVVYKVLNGVPSGSREFSITLDEANYLPSTGHYYKFIDAPDISWEDAKAEAESDDLKLYGIQGYLATITTPEEAQLAGEQADGNGWIGGSDKDQDNTWKWVTGPEAGKTFWFGLWNGTNNGADFDYENWDNNEPNNWLNGATGIAHAEDYLHIYKGGKWNDYPNNGNNILGYIVEYGGMTPGDTDLNNSAGTKIVVGEITNYTEEAVCVSGSVTLSATSTSGVVNWYTDLSDTTPIHTGDTFKTPNITATTPYYAGPSDCLEGRVEVVASVYPLPTVISFTEDEICESGTVTLNATPSAGTVFWYGSATGTDLISSGETLIIPNLSITTAYYAEVRANNCISATRTQVIATVLKTPAPIAPAIQEFCDGDNPMVSDLIATGTSIKWYDSSTGGTLLDPTTALSSGFYYASDTVDSCEGLARTTVEVILFENVAPLPSSSIPVLQTCDDDSDGNDTNGQTFFDLTVNESILLNGKNASDFTFFYFEDDLRTIPISDPTNYYNSTQDDQLIYVQIVNNANNSCATDTEITIKVNPLPVIQEDVTLKNCDEDGTPDGFTGFNLTEADPFITLDIPNLTVNYYATANNAETETDVLDPIGFNNSTASTVFARVENSFGCYRIATVTLYVSAPKLDTGYVFNLNTCENDLENDGIATFNLTQASSEILNQLPTGENLSVHYYTNPNDALLELNEITPQDSYRNETAYNQTLIVRIEDEINGDCYDIGPYVALSVESRPDFQVKTQGTVCLDNPPLEMKIINPDSSLTYEWTNPAGTIISYSDSAEAFEGGIYSVKAFSSAGCESFAQEIIVIESESAKISLDDITIIDDSNNNSISIDDSNLGIGNYEFALNDGFFQDDPYFDNVPAGIHTLFIQDKNGCSTVGIEISIIGFPKFFTPNGDNVNDTWQVSGLSPDFHVSSLIYIFDRFGKLLIEIDPQSEGWDGFYNGIMLPASDYWFSVQLVDKNDNIRERRGHFSLIRR